MCAKSGTIVRANNDLARAVKTYGTPYTLISTLFCNFPNLFKIKILNQPALLANLL